MKPAWLHCLLLYHWRHTVGVVLDVCNNKCVSGHEVLLQGSSMHAGDWAGPASAVARLDALCISSLTASAARGVFVWA
jgi:hypothetical protein